MLRELKVGFLLRLWILRRKWRLQILRKNGGFKFCLHDTCFNSFPYSSPLKEAAASSGGIEEPSSEIRPHRCPNCNKTYSYGYYLESHLKKCKAKKDSKAAAFCEVCGLQFSSRTTLIRHQVEKHGIRPEGGVSADAGKLPCEYCDRLFDDLPMLVS